MKEAVLARVICFLLGQDLPSSFLANSGDYSLRVRNNSTKDSSRSIAFLPCCSLYKYFVYVISVAIRYQIDTTLTWLYFLKVVSIIDTCAGSGHFCDLVYSHIVLNLAIHIHLEICSSTILTISTTATSCIASLLC